jgi:hypothetical protein
MEVISLFETTKNPLQPGLLKAALSVLCSQLSPPVSYNLAAVGVKYVGQGSSYLPSWYLKVIREQKIRESCSEGGRWQNRSCGCAPPVKRVMT